jgi:hypothetical protein
MRQFFLDHHLDSTTLWLEKQQLLVQLYGFSHASILDDLTEQSLFQATLTRFIYESSFDALNGGLITFTASDSEHAFFTKPTALNAMIADFLLCSDQVLYQGIYSQIAKKILAYLGQQQSLEEIPFDLAQLPCFVPNSISKKLLTPSEFGLFEALVNNGNSNFDDSEGRVCCYRRSLIDASQLINMPMKQAQIIEHQLVEKLTDWSNKQQTTGKFNVQINPPYPKTSPMEEQSTAAQCETALSLIRLLKIESLTLYQQQLENTLNNLDAWFRRIRKKPATLQLHYLNVRMAELQLSNLNQDWTDFFTLFDYCEFDNMDAPLTTLAIYHIDLLKLFLSELNNRSGRFTIEVNKSNECLDSLVQSDRALWSMLTAQSKSQRKALGIFLNCSEFIFLSEQQAVIEQQKMRLQSKFNPFQYVFQTE